jgi:hypothetical protein
VVLYFITIAEKKLKDRVHLQIPVLMEAEWMVGVFEYLSVA